MSNPVDNTPSPIYFLHLPKCAGSSLSRVLVERTTGVYGGETTFSIRGEAELAAFHEFTRETRDQFKLVTGHFAFGLHRLTSFDSVRYITMLREPVDRVESNFYFAAETPEHYLHSIIKDGMSLRELLEREHYIEYHNHQTVLLSGVPNLRPQDQNEEILKLAKENLDKQFLSVGLTERFDESLVLISQALDWPVKEVVSWDRMNVTRNRPAREVVDDETRVAIRKFNQLDIELYEHARIRFEDIIQKEGKRFDRDLRRLSVIKWKRRVKEKWHNIFRQ